MPNFRRGAAAIQEDVDRNSGQGKFRSFAPSISWSGEDMEKYILILTPIDEAVSVDYHGFIPVAKRKGGKYRYEDFISRKDEAIGEDHDRLEDDLDRSPSRKVIGVGVELEPTFETINGRKKPNGFAVATRTYNKRGNDGEEEVTVAKIGLIIQTAKMMWNPLRSLDATKGPLEFLPLKIVREGTGENTSYTVMDFDGLDADLSGVVEHLDGLSYLAEKQDEVIAEIDSLDDEEFDLRSAQVVARYILDTRLEELADADRYEELTGNIRWLPQPFTKGDPKFVNDSGPASESSGSDDSVEEEAPKPKPKRTRAPRKSQKAAAKEKVEQPEAEAETEAEEVEEEKPKKKESQRGRFDELREQMKAKQTEKASA